MIVSRLAKIPNTHKMIKNVAEIASSVTPNGGAKVLKNVEMILRVGPPTYLHKIIGLISSQS